jgi:hypothetical protein
MPWNFRAERSPFPIGKGGLHSAQVNRRAAHFLLMTAACLFVWLAAVPAFAAVAPYCDHRGASALAPVPQLQIRETRIEATPADCDDSASIGAHIQGGKRSPDRASPGGEIEPAVVAAGGTCVVEAPLTGFLRIEGSGRPRSGHSSSIERPPRV